MTDATRISTDHSSGPNDTLIKLTVAGTIALIVGAIAAVSGVGIVFVVIAVLASVVVFWILDSLLRQPTTQAATPQLHPLAPPPLRSASHADSRAGAHRTDVVPATMLTSEQAPSMSSPVTPADAPPPEQARLDPTLLDPNSVEIRANAQGKNRLMSIRIAKHGHSIAECEDAVAVDPRRAVLAVSDGASSSFGAGVWADALARQFVTGPPKPLSVGSFSSWIAQARSVFVEAAASQPINDASPGWWSERGARQGAFATIIGAAIMNDGDTRVATVMCLGDSCAFVLDGPPGARTLRRALPFEDATQFGSHPALLASHSDRRHPEPSWTTIPMDRGDLLVLASDAVAEWLLADPRRFALLDDADPQRLANRLITERTDGRIVNDDLTLATLELTT
jgi:serine/threonine protein phosphatase PrpC